MPSKPELRPSLLAGSLLLLVTSASATEPTDSTPEAPAPEAPEDTPPATDEGTTDAPTDILVAAPVEEPVEAPPEPTRPAVVGSVLPIAPSVAPGAIPERARDPLTIARERWLERDATGVVAILTPWLDTRTGPYGRTRTSGHLLLGLAHMQLENWNLASRHFYRVRRTGGPLAPYGAWYEAKVDHLRGRHHVAVRECHGYREKYPEGAHADECLLLIGDAYSAAGNRGAGIASYRKYLDKHPETPRKEEIELATTLAYVDKAPKQAIRLLHGLALSHSFPSTDLAVQAALADLSERGFEVALPSDNTTRMRRAEALRRSGQYDAAWALFQELAKGPDADPQIKAWVDANEERFAWGTRKYDVYAEVLSEQYEARPDAEVAWRIFRAWSRDGRYDKVVEWGHKGMEDHGSHHRWRAAYDDMAWATLHAGLYEESAERWDKLSKRGGAFGRKARFYSAYSSYRHGDLETALVGFDKLLEHPGEQKSRALYWRAKARAANGDDEGAKTDFEAAAASDRSGWYTMVQQPGGNAGDAAWRVRDGRWHGLTPLELPDWDRPEQRAVTALEAFPLERPITRGDDGAARPALEAPAAKKGDWSALSWSSVQKAAHTPVQNEPVEWPGASVPTSAPELPDGYLQCRYWDPTSAQKDFYRFAESVKGIWPDLPAAHDLALAGEYTDAARLVYAAFEEYRSAWNESNPTDERVLAIRALNIRAGGWRPYLLFVRDHYHAARACHGLHKSAPDADERIANLRLSYPVVEPVEIWRHSQTYNVDPYLVMGIMRQESTYRNTALSPVGAIGLIQVMPRTGARVAAMMGEHTYSPGDLEDPAINLRYGIFYLSKLLDRFDGVFPLAVASYNGGPHNVSRWYERHQGNIELDAYVEQIEYDETRDYVKKVSGHYARYVAIYEGSDARVVLPPTPRGDDATIIDF